MVEIAFAYVEGIFLCYLNDPCLYDYVYDYMYNCLLCMSNCAIMFVPQIALQNLYKDYNFYMYVCCYSANHLKRLVSCLNRVNAKERVLTRL